MRVPTWTVWFTTRGATSGSGKLKVRFVGFHAVRLVATVLAKLVRFKLPSSQEKTRSNAIFSAA